MERRSFLALALMVTILGVPLASAAETLELYPTPKTDVARSVQNLFNATLAIAMVVFIGVEALLFYIVWRFRNNKTVPAGETHRGHTKAEIVWTVVPAVVLLGLGSVSAVTLFEIDTVPENVDFAVRVEASQFTWRFLYPDENGTAYDGSATWCRDHKASCTFDELRVESGRLVRLDLVSRDVEHQLFIPNFAIKISAIPGRTNQQWFLAPEPGEYPIECSMYCGFGHHDMGASNPRTKVVVFAPGAQVLPYGAPTTATG